MIENDFYHEGGYTPPESVVNFQVTVLEAGHALGNFTLPQVQDLGYGTAEELAIGAVTLPWVYFLGSSGNDNNGEGVFLAPQVTIAGTGQAQDTYNLPQVSILGYTGAHSDVVNGIYTDADSGYNLPQVTITGTASSVYCAGEMELPQILINIVDKDHDGVEDDKVWVDTDDDGEPDTEFYDPVKIDTDGDGIPDTWVESWYQATIPVEAIATYNIPQVNVNGHGNTQGSYLLPQLQIAGTGEAEQMMQIGIDVPTPVVYGTFRTVKNFTGVIKVPAPSVVATGRATQPDGEAIINVPLPKVVASGKVVDASEGDAVVNVPKPKVVGSISSTTTTDAEILWSDVKSCIQ